MPTARELTAVAMQALREVLPGDVPPEAYPDAEEVRLEVSDAEGSARREATRAQAKQDADGHAEERPDGVQCAQQ